MKKFFLMFLVAPLLLAGCTSQNNNTNNAEDNDLLMKEKCNGYLSIAKERIEDKNNESRRLVYFHVGTYYSKSRKSCITKYKEQPLSVGSPEEIRTNYYDELTGEEIVSYPGSFEEVRAEFEQGLQLIN